MSHGSCLVGNSLIPAIYLATKMLNPFSPVMCTIINNPQILIAVFKSVDLKTAIKLGFQNSFLHWWGKCKLTFSLGTTVLDLNQAVKMKIEDHLPFANKLRPRGTFSTEVMVVARKQLKRYAIGLNHTAAMLSPKRLKTFVLPPPRLVPKYFDSRLRVRNLLSMANMAAARIRPIKHLDLVFINYFTR